MAVGTGTWSVQNGNADGGLHGIWFADKLHGWAVGEGASGSSNKILKTVNGGATWTVPTTVPGTDTLNRVFFSDATHGLAVGEPSDGPDAAALRTSDGGDTWTQATSGTGNNDLEAVYMFPDNLTAYASGSSGTLIKTLDGGATWADASAGLPAISDGNNETTKSYSIDAMWWPSATEGWLAGNRLDDATPGLILHTINAGITWTVVDSHTDTGGYESMMFTDANHGWAVGDCKSTTTTPSPSPSTTVSPSPVTTCDRGGLSKWDGSKWTNVSPSQAVGYDLQGVWFVDSTHGWVVGDSSEDANAPGRFRVILYTADGGVTWTEQVDTGPQPTPSSASINADSGLTFVYATDLCHAWASGGESLILGYVDSCPTPAASQAAATVGLPAAGVGSSPVSTFWNVLAVVVVASVPFAALLRRRASRRR
jgi:photosystem II stability/assembly factor-like uncharacterized protein